MKERASPIAFIALAVTLLAGGALALTLVGVPAPAAARYVQLDGRVQWIAGQKLVAAAEQW